MVEEMLLKRNNVLLESQRVAHIGSWYYFLSTGKTIWSEETYRIYGVNPDTFIPNLDAFIHIIYPDDRVLMHAWINDCQNALSPKPLEFRIVWPDGSIRIVCGYGELRYDAENLPSYLLGMVCDVTEQKKTEENLKKSQLQSKVFVSNAPNSIAMFDRDMNYLAVSDRWISDYGRGSIDLIGRNHYELHPDIPEGWKRAHQRGLQGETIRNREDKWQQVDGSEHWLKWSLLPWIDTDGAIGGIIISAEDITERIIAEDKLRLWGDSFEKVGFGLAMADAATNTFISVNPTFAKERGYDREELVGKSILTVFPEEMVDEVKDFISFLDDGSHIVFESMHVCKDGRQFPVMLDITTIKSAEGVPLRRIAYAMDISGRQQSEKALRESEARYRTLFENMNAGFVLFEVVQDDQGIPVDLIILAANKGFETTTGLNVEKVVGRYLTQVLPGIEQDPADWIGTYGKIALSGEAQSFEQGSELLGVFYSVSAYQAGPKQCGVTFQDITQRKRGESELKESEQLLKFALEGSGEGVWEYNLKNNKIKITKRFEEILGFSEGEYVVDVDTWRHNIHPEDFSLAMVKFNAYLEGNAAAYFNEYRMLCKDGYYKWMLERGIIAERNSDGMPLRFVGTLNDISEFKKAENKLRIAATAFEAQEGMLVTGANKEILSVNTAFTRITGYAAEDVVGKYPNILKSHRQNRRFYIDMWESINVKGFWEGEIWNKRKNGEIYPATLTVSAVKNPAGIVSNYVGTITDITLSKNSAEEIQRLAFYDPLTGLANRRLLQDRLHQAISSCVRTGRTGAILFIDLDSFKTINDTLGHDIGDLLLQEVGKRIKSCIRDGDTVARPGGDEFIVMLNNLSEDEIDAAHQAESVAEKIRSVLNESYTLNGHHYHNTSSIGISLFGSHRKTVEEVMKQADIAMYQAKKGGRNTNRFFDPKMQEAISARAQLETELRMATQLQQFQLYYQIQTDSLNRVIGAEALIRWQHPQRGLVSPIEFIPIAEEAGMILDIGNWVLSEACNQIKKWEREALTSTFVISINVSARQFHQVHFVDSVKEAVVQNGINPKHLKIELTESMLVDNIEGTIVKMHELKAIGITLSLDDFGTGYSSLRYLQRLPIDQLKIDQSFVQNISTKESDQNIVLTIIRMALSLKLDLIAEGVETQQQLKFLQESGCHKYQGYLFGKPMPVEEFEASLYLS